MERTLEGGEVIHRMKPGRKPKVAAVESPVVDTGEGTRIDLASFMAAQAYAMRVWEGQSVDVPPAERKERVFNALRGQNLSTDGIIFPA